MIYKLIKKEINQLRKFIHRQYYKAENNKKLIDDFHSFYYESGIHKKTLWFGVPIWKLPQDLFIYQEIIYKIRPDLIIETGTAYGGSALYMAQLMDLLNKGKLISIDIDDSKKRQKHKRISYFKGSSVSNQCVNYVKQQIKGKKDVLVILDSDHRKDHVLKEMKIYSKMVTKNSYLIVEDSNINGHPVWPEYGPGPMEAINSFLKNNKTFIVDRSMEKFFITWNPRGYLKKIK